MEATTDWPLQCLTYFITTGTEEGKQVPEIMCSVELTQDSKVKVIYNTSDDDLEHTFKRRGISPQDIIS
jgi:hypothetical protein